MLPQTLAHRLAYVLGAVNNAARERPKAPRCGNMEAKLFLIAVDFRAAPL
jgi:hypothetical protein